MMAPAIIFFALFFRERVITAFNGMGGAAAIRDFEVDRGSISQRFAACVVIGVITGDAVFVI